MKVISVTILLWLMFFQAPGGLPYSLDEGSTANTGLTPPAGTQSTSTTEQPDPRIGGRQNPQQPDQIRNRDEGRPAASRGGRNGKGGSGLGNYTVPPPANNVPEHLFNIVLGRPTACSITVRVLLHQAATASLQYGPAGGPLLLKTHEVPVAARDTVDFVLTSLQGNTRYAYRLICQPEGGPPITSNEYSFHTQRATGSRFVFTVTSDSHLDENTSGEVYLRTLNNALAETPDFHFELGDTFMTGKYVKPEYSEPQYLAQRYYLGSLCHSAPLFFALGNHDGEQGSRGSLTWATQTRKRLFPNPEPDGFYTGNEQSEPVTGLPQNYYQWKWGDAQFIVLDPFRYTTQRGRDGNNWSWTLGDRQYRWLKASLENTTAAYRFVFLHHLVGGSPGNSRGGIEVARLWEWGGESPDGTKEFASRRPGWELPIHDLLVKHGVSIVFHGHDHLFVKQDLDGIVYQEVPQPGHPRSGNIQTAKEYGYLSGETQSSSGLIRVQVGAAELRADYVRTWLPASENDNRRNGDVSYSYVVPAKK